MPKLSALMIGVWVPVGLGAEAFVEAGEEVLGP